MKKNTYFPNLNGLRFIGAIMVIIVHVEIKRKELGINNYHQQVSEFGNIAVTMFFVLSGFLLTYLSLNKKEFSIKRFYLKRFWRIYPHYFIAAAIGLFITLKSTDFSLGIIPLFVFLLPNVFHALFAADALGHLWFVGVMVQFYIIWGLIFKFARKKILFVMVSLIIGIITLRTLVILMFEGSPLNIFFVSFQLEKMAIGGIGAYILYKNKSKILNIIYNRYLYMLVCVLLVLSIIFKFHTLLVTNIFYSTLFLIIIMNLAQRPNILDTRFFNFMGEISYEMYLYHPVVIIIIASFFN